MWSKFIYFSNLAVEGVLGIFGLRLYEEPSYVVLDRRPNQFEIRKYEHRVAAEVEINIGADVGRNEAFRVLFAYIAGANRQTEGDSLRVGMTVPVELYEGEQVAMTVPVQTQEHPDKVIMRFLLPTGFTLKAAPTPTDARVRIIEVKSEVVATLRFSGLGRDILEKKAELIANLTGTKWLPSGKPYAMFYDAPFTIPFLRRNEAAVLVTEGQ
jgi:hypothetical protein